ncbi:MAG: peroxiredoxin [Methanosarcina flavescens]|jgi:peroxiredoxin (alkyl hydroperoxide reductase subunit C)|uniref:Peroxiredoxin n=1 Tax=Methanosarcina flavescens TaxID=1715806 RepID=A0A660HRD0_9EURY|nr:peroxiredoxin [Methanosarcina flavescens]AYK14845.1 peroxiredoxin [Methanosarcina flavescens]NLK33058.1 peroxiredoxin [Methanosarcina flavescens]
MVEAEYEKICIPLIGEDAPSFEAVTTQGPINFPEDYKGKWVILFSHPADFTPVCTTEFMTFASMQEEFREMNTELIGVSIDSVFSHIAWLKRIEEKIEYKGMKNVKIGFPVIADLRMDVAKKYGMVQLKGSRIQTARATFVIDPESKIRAMVYYPINNGRNIQEFKRLISAMQKNYAEGVSTPANWQPGDDVIIRTPRSMNEVEERLEKVQDEVYCLDWFICLKKDSKNNLE